MRGGGGRGRDGQGKSDKGLMIPICSTHLALEVPPGEWSVRVGMGIGYTSRLSLTGVFFCFSMRGIRMRVFY